MHAAALEQAVPGLRTAVATLMDVALTSLAAGEGNPTFADQLDTNGWNRFGQREFGARRRDTWLMPPAVSTLGWLDRLPAMQPVREAFAADPVLSKRVDCLVGVEFSLNARQLEWLLIKELLEPMVVRLRAYRFEPAAFGEAYSRLETGLRATHVKVVEFLPVNALRATADVKQLRLDGDVVLEPMTNSQMSWAISRGAVPAEFAGGPLFVNVEPEHQWALTRTRPHPIISTADLPEKAVGPDFPSLREPGQRFVTALRIVCGGSAVVTRSILQQHDDDFPIIGGGSAVLSAVEAVDYSRPTLLAGGHLEDVATVYGWLGTPTVMDDVMLQRALRRLVFAGAHRYAEDRLADLMTCGEIIFIKRLGHDRTPTKGAWVAGGAADLLRDDTVITADAERIRAFILAAYGVRNHRVHGDDASAGAFVLLDGSSTPSLELMIDDVEAVVRRCLYLILSGRTPRPLPSRTTSPVDRPTAGRNAGRRRGGRR